MSIIKKNQLKVNQEASNIPIFHWKEKINSVDEYTDIQKELIKSDTTKIVEILNSDTIVAPKLGQISQTILKSTRFIPINAVSSIDRLFDWNDAQTYKFFYETVSEFYKCFTDDSEQRDAWRVALSDAIDKTLIDFTHIQKFIEGADLLMQQEKLIKNIFAQDLANLQPLEILPTVIKDEDASTNLEGLLTEIKNEINKGTKISFKGLQELQNQLEQLQHQPMKDDESLSFDPSITSQQQLVDLTSEIEKLTQRCEYSLDLIIKAIDTLDLIRNAAEQAKLNESWINQIDQATENFIIELEKLDVKEIKAKGEFLDGNLMISIGTIPAESAQGFEQFQVYLVHERGFINTTTGKVLREAKVINVY